MIALIPILIYSGGKLSQWRSVPWYTLGAGIFGLIVIGAISYMIPRIGIAASITTIVAGQLLVGTILDHFGLLGAATRSMDVTRAFGLAVVLVGVLADGEIGNVIRLTDRQLPNKIPAGILKVPSPISLAR